MNAAIEQYNELVTHQCALTTTIQDATSTIVQALASKEKAAEEQKTLQVAEIGVPYPQYSVADVRAKIVDEVIRRLEQRDATQLRDWSCRPLGPGGNMEEYRRGAGKPSPDKKKADAGNNPDARSYRSMPCLASPSLSRRRGLPDGK